MTNPLPIKITGLNQLNDIANDDIFLIVDKSDTTQSANGSTKNITGQVLKNYVFNGFSFGSIDNHTDVTISGATGGQLLRLDTDGKWKNWTPDYLKSADVDLSNVVRDTDFTSSGLLKRGSTAGSYSVISDNSANWNSAYNWGNHASAGYLTSSALSNISIDVFSDVDLISTAPTNGQILTWSQPTPGVSGKWVPANAPAGGGSSSITLSSFSVIFSPTPNAGGGLAYNSTNGVFTYTPPNLSSYLTSISGQSISQLSDVNTETIVPSVGNVLRWDGTNWAPAAPSGTGAGRTTKSGTLNNLPNNNTAVAGQLDITDVAKTYSLLKIQTSYAAWVTLYTNDAARDADASRSETTDPLPGSGVIAEVITTGAQTQFITPGAIGWNDDATPTSTVYAKVVNKSGSQVNLTVTLTFVPLEA